MSAAELQGRNTTFESVSGSDFLSVARGPSDLVASQQLSSVARSVMIGMRLPHLYNSGPRRLIELRFPTSSRVQFTDPVTVTRASMQKPPSPGNSIFVTLPTILARFLPLPSTIGPTAPVHGLSVPSEPSPEDKLHAKLFSYLDLSPDWDGRGGVVPSRQAVLDALGFLARRPSGIPLPFPQIASDGEVGLYWRSEVVHAEVGFCGDGDFSYYARYTPHGGEFSKCGRDGCTVRAGPWPADLTRILDKLSQEDV